jgi:hypothetical protein
VADVFRLRGEYSATPATIDVPGVAASGEALGEFIQALYLAQKAQFQLTLSGDAPVSVAFGALDAAHVVIIQTPSKVRARITSADGSLQSIPVDPLLILMASAVPLTAIDLTRLAGVNTEVSVFLGKRT